MDSNLTVIILAALAAMYGAFNAWLDKRPPRPRARRDKQPKSFL